MSQLRFIDLFAGIGGIRLAFESVGMQCVFSSEWDRFSARTYEANFGERPAGDIRAVRSEDIPAFDVLCAGFPCQPFSIAGVSKKNALGREHGFADETQGTLFFEIARILKERQPRAFLLENVKNLRSHDGGRTFDVVLRTLQSLGYRVEFQVISAAPVLPQKRERIYIVGFLDPMMHGAFRFPEPADLPVPDMLKRAVRARGVQSGSVLYPGIGLILDQKVDAKYTLTDHLWEYLQRYKEKHSRLGHGFGFGLTPPSSQARTLSARYYKDGSEILIPQRKSKANPDGNPRRLTPRECARLMGFPESFQIVVSDTQAYKQFGNSVAVPVVQGIARSIRDAAQAGAPLSLSSTSSTGRARRLLAAAQGE